MTAKKKVEPDDKEQSARFVETARSLEVEETGKLFRNAIQKTLRQSDKNKRK